jgi:uncharacterized protein YndB with AHSA1/START domain
VTVTAHDVVSVTTQVSVDPRTAFRVFTEVIDEWWRHGPRYRFRPGREGVMRFEPRVGGRLLEVYDDEGDHFEVGRVLQWEPGRRLVFEWRAHTFEPGQRTEVEVRFEPAGSGTRVTLEHRGWDSLPADHPARQGHTGEAFVSLMGLFWADLLVSLRARARD